MRPARGPDGTIYAIDVEWIARDAGDKGVTVGPDGTIYTGSENDVYGRLLTDARRHRALARAANAHTRAVRAIDGTSVFTAAIGLPVAGPSDGTVPARASAYSPTAALLWTYNTVSSSRLRMWARTGATTIPSIQRLSAHHADPNGTLEWSLTMPKSVV